MNNLLTPKQRFLTALSCKQPDRVPLFDFLFSQNLYEHFLGHKPEAYNSEDAIALTNALKLDGVHIAAGAADTFETVYSAPDLVIGEWGTSQKIDPSISWPTGGPIAYPVENRSDWKNYEMPDPCGVDFAVWIERHFLRTSMGRQVRGRDRIHCAY